MSQEANGLLDASVVILLPRLNDPSVLPRRPSISAITLAELTVGPLVAQTDEERVVRQAHLQQAEADFNALPFDARAARAFGGVAASLRRSGRKTAARAYDAMIAAVALANGLPLSPATRMTSQASTGCRSSPYRIPTSTHDGAPAWGPSGR